MYSIQHLLFCTATKILLHILFPRQVDKWMLKNSKSGWHTHNIFFWLNGCKLSCRCNSSFLCSLCNLILQLLKLRLYNSHYSTIYYGHQGYDSKSKVFPEPHEPTGQQHFYSPHQTPAYTMRPWILGWCNELCTCLVPSFLWYSLHLPMEGWPGWVDLGGWLNNKMAQTWIISHLITNAAWPRASTLNCWSRPTVTTKPNHHQRYHKSILLNSWQQSILQKCQQWPLTHDWVVFKAHTDTSINKNVCHMVSRQIQIPITKQPANSNITSDAMCDNKYYERSQQKITTFVRILCASCSNFPLSWNLKWRLPLAEPLLLRQQTSASQTQCFNQATTCSTRPVVSSTWFDHANMLNFIWIYRHSHRQPSTTTYCPLST